MRCARRLKLDCGGELTEPDTTRLPLRLPPACVPAVRVYASTDRTINALRINHTQYGSSIRFPFNERTST